MRTKKPKYNSDFFESAQKIMGKKNFSKALKDAENMAKELRLKAARELLGKNQADLKGMTQPEVSKIESRKDLKISTLAKYAEALGMQLRITLVSKKDKKKKPILVLG
jgi:hypothetical protein